jgi:hypothetical protein
MTNVTNRYHRKYDIFNDGVGARVLNTETGKRGTVTEIKETAWEYIEPFVKYDDADEPKKEMTWNLVVLENE